MLLGNHLGYDPSFDAAEILKNCGMTPLPICHKTIADYLSLEPGEVTKE